MDERQLTDHEIQTAEKAIKDIKESEMPEYQWLFHLVGLIKGRYMGIRSSDMQTAALYKPLAFYFAKLANRDLIPSGGYIDWGDQDGITLEFYKAWNTRKHAQDSKFLDIAIEYSKENWLGLPEDRNKWVVRVVNTAFCLQEFMPDSPFIIPVNERTASLFGTSLRTLSLAVNQAIKDKYLKVMGKAVERPDCRLARRLGCNFGHPEIKAGMRVAREHMKNWIASLNATKQ